MRLRREAELFLDTSFALALASEADEYHARALEIEGVRAEGAVVVTTHAVLLEIGNALSRMRFREAATRMLDALQRDPEINVLPVDDELFSAGWALFRRRTDKEWGLTDCISFVVMQRMGLTDALTADRHFQQAGFRALLLESA